MHAKVPILAGVIKGGLMAALLTAMDLGFVKSIVIAIVSGSFTFLGMTLAAVISVREARKNRDILHDVRRKVGADHRATDAVAEKVDAVQDELGRRRRATDPDGPEDVD